MFYSGVIVWLCGAGEFNIKSSENYLHLMDFFLSIVVIESWTLLQSSRYAHVHSFHRITMWLKIQLSPAALEMSDGEAPETVELYHNHSPMAMDKRNHCNFPRNVQRESIRRNVPSIKFRSLTLDIGLSISVQKLPSSMSCGPQRDLLWASHSAYQNLPEQKHRISSMGFLGWFTYAN